MIELTDYRIKHDTVYIEYKFNGVFKLFVADIHDIHGYVELNGLQGATIEAVIKSYITFKLKPSRYKWVRFYESRV